MEMIMTFIKSLPPLLGTVAQVLVVVIFSMLAISLIAGFWIGITILRRRADYLAEISFLPFRITFHPRDRSNDTNP